MGQGFLAQALGDAGALQPQAELAGDQGVGKVGLGGWLG